jgi:hypothetical protein
LKGVLASKFERVAVLGEDDSMAAAYALDRVLKAVAEVGSMSAFAAAPDVLIVVGVAMVSV